MIESMSEEGLGRLHEAMAAHVAKGAVPGLVTLVARGDDVRVDVMGSMAFDQHEPMRRETIFRITSMTKPILALATMMLAEDGALALDEPVDRLLPELAQRRVLKRIDGPLDDTVPARRAITVDDLLTFRMGHGLIMEPTFDPPYPIVNAANEQRLVMAYPDPRTPHDPDEWIKRFGALPLMYQPGERWQYNTGALVLSVLVARAAGRSLPELLQARIFEPLGMKDTGFTVPAEKIDRLPSNYQTNVQSGKLERQTTSGPGVWTTPPPFPSGAAGLVSTIDDYLAFARLLRDEGMHKGKRLVSRESVRRMTTNHLTPEQMGGGGPILGGQGWGYCVAIATAPDEISAKPGRYGWNGGYGTFWFNDPSRDLTAILMTQVSDVLFDGTTAEFAKLAMNS